MSALTELSDTNLDNAFAASFDARSIDVAEYYGREIRERLTTVTGFIGGLFGQHRFPKYEARLNYSQSEAAQSSVADAASAAVNSVGNTLKTGGLTLALVALAGVAIYAALK